MFVTAAFDLAYLRNELIYLQLNSICGPTDRQYGTFYFYISSLSMR